MRCCMESEMRKMVWRQAKRQWLMDYVRSRVIRGFDIDY